ncbi:LEM domain [Halocaridina rubra]|uniref:LEM domain n=1 Tax=Halocaridina rubra TaxID=373956 RepID=A0AAN9ABA7_HALRR
MMIFIEINYNLISARNKVRRSSVHAAASMGFCELLELLLVNGGDPLLGDIKGHSPVDVAYKNNRTDALNLLNIQLDNETYSHPAEQLSDIALSLWRREVVGIVVVPEEPSFDSHNGNDPPVLHENKDVDESKLSSLMNHQKENERYKESYVKTTEPEKTSLSIIGKTDINSEILYSEPSKQFSLNSERYFEYLRQELVGNADSESDVDRFSQQKFLRKNLENGYTSGKCNRSSVPHSMDSFTETFLSEFDTAYTNINMTGDYSYDSSFNFDGTYIPGGLHHHQLHPDGDFSLDLFSGMSKDETYINGLYDTTNTTQGLHGETETSYSNSLKDTTHTTNGEHSESETLYSNVTCPQNMTLPEYCTSFQLLKAPKKNSHVSNIKSQISSSKSGEAAKVSSHRVGQEETLFDLYSWSLISESFGQKNVSKIPYIIDEVDAIGTTMQNMTGPKLSSSLECINASETRSYTESTEQSKETDLKKQNRQGTRENESLKSLLPKRLFNISFGNSSSKVQYEKSQNGYSSLSEYGTAKSCISGGSSSQSLISVVEEFLYRDLEAGITLIERRCPSSASFSSLLTNGYGSGTLAMTQTPKKMPTLPDDVPDGIKIDQSFDSLGTLTDSIRGLTGEKLRKKLIDIGFTPGPVLPSSQRVYQRQLLRLRRHPELLQDNQRETEEYPRELKSALKDPSAIEWYTWMHLEKTVSSQFNQPDPSRHWRDGTSKTCFNYLLLDPRITEDLPIRGVMMEEAERFKCFVSAIFYIGKGSRGRPYYHLYEAMMPKEKKKQISEKVAKIQDIWSEGVGVVSLHIFQNTIPVEAWTREAAMISAIGLQNVCNSIKGTFYGVASTWKGTEQRRLGTLLLHRALNIFMLEGERQLRPSDVSPPPWCR